MDQFNCTYGRFTDRLLVFNKPIGDCSQDVAAWLTVAITILVLRIALAFVQIQVWMERERKNKDSKQPKIQKSRWAGGRRLPIVPAFSVIETIGEILFVSLGSANIANTENGASLFLLMVACAGLHVILCVGSYRIVRLGRKLVPISRGALVVTKETSTKLASFDMILALLFYGGVAAAFSADLLLLLGFLVYPGEERIFLYFLYLIIIFVASGSLTIIYQYERCIQAIKKSITNKEGDLPSINGSATIKKVIVVMRKGQCSIVIFGIGCGVIFVGCASQLMPFNWIAVCVQFFEDLLLFAYFTALLMPRRKPSSSDLNATAPKNSAMVAHKTPSGEGGILMAASPNSPVTNGKSTAEKSINAKVESIST